MTVKVNPENIQNEITLRLGQDLTLVFCVRLHIDIHNDRKVDLIA